MTNDMILVGGRVLFPDGTLETVDVHIAGGRISHDPPSGDALRIDCEGLHVLPGLVDVHGDAFELELHPRPRVDIPFSIAMTSVDRQLLTNGITTAFHGLTLSWEPGARSLDAGRRFMDAMHEMRPRLVADHRIQLRWETFAHDAIGDIAVWLEREPKPAVAFNDHTTSTLEKIEAGTHAKLEQWAQRAGVSVDDYVVCVREVANRKPQVASMIESVAELGRRNGAVLLSHDEREVAERTTNRTLGITVCEFPLSAEVAGDAKANGEHVIMGGPNVIRGGSHTGAMSAEDAIRDGLCSVLASDYYYPSLFHAAQRLVERGVLDLAHAWRLISTNAAEAMGLADRGTLAPGKRADIVVADCTGDWRIVHTIAGGVVTSLDHRAMNRDHRG